MKGESHSIKPRLMTDGVAELKVICTIAGEWGKPACQPYGLLV